MADVLSTIQQLSQRTGSRGAKLTASNQGHSVTVTCFSLSAQPEPADSQDSLVNSDCGNLSSAVVAKVHLPNRQRVLIADVTGYAGTAPVAAAAVHQHFGTFAHWPKLSLSQLVLSLDQVVSRAPDALYATACLADCFADGRVELANCGHPWPIVVDRFRGSRPIRPRVPSLPLGIHAASPSIDKDQPGPGGRLLIHTEGLPGDPAAKCQLAKAPVFIDALKRLPSDGDEERHSFHEATAILAQWPEHICSGTLQSHRARRAVGKQSFPIRTPYGLAGIGRSVDEHEWLNSGTGLDGASAAILPYGARRRSFSWL